MSYKSNNAKRKAYRRKLLKQKLMGVAMLLISALVIFIAMNGTTVEEQCATPVILLIPFGIGLIRSKRIYII